MPLAKAWRQYKKTSKDAENDDPTDLPNDQLFLILITENGGQPLEDVLMGTFEEAKSIILQAGLSMHIMFLAILVMYVLW